ncbi:uncharacterized protein [Antedon mediterranea]|uniref:uncharacterized protein n=1 Tax=Antedon mediterranea TaxID=105859 RepID=UPI003AF6F594
MHRFIQWPKCVSGVIIICLLTLGISGTRCPNGFDCSGVNNCYLIYSKDGEWKYRDPKGETHGADDNVYSHPNCYKYIKVDNKPRSCDDAQRKCELVGGNITVINSLEEYNQLTENVLHVLSVGNKNRFYVHVQNMGCKIINVHDRYGLSNTVTSDIIECSTTVRVNSIICESTDKTKICQVPTTSTPRSVSTTSLFNTQPEMSTSENSHPINTDKTISSTNMSSPNSNFTSGNKQASDDLLVIICVPLVVIILVIIIALFLIRRKKKKRNTSNSNYAKGGRVSYSNGVLIDTHSGECTENAAMSPPANQNDVASNVYAVPPNLYAVPNKKKHKDSGEAYDSLNASDMVPDTETDADVTYGNTEFLSIKNGGEFYDSINAADMQSYRVGNDNENIPYENKAEAYYANSTNMQSTTGTNTDEKPDGEIYSAVNEEAQNNDFGNEYGKLDIDTSPQNDDMYSYVDTSINTSPEDTTYDRLQRNK